MNITIWKRKNILLQYSKCINAQFYYQTGSYSTMAGSKVMQPMMLNDN